MISKYYCISFIVCSLNFTFAQQLPEQVTLEQAIAFGEKNNRNIQKANLEIRKAYKDQ